MTPLPSGRGHRCRQAIQAQHSCLLVFAMIVSQKAVTGTRRVLPPRASTAPRTGPVLLSTLQLLKVQGSPTRHLAGSSAPTSPRASAGSPALHASASAAVVSHICGTLSRGYYPFIRCLSQTLLCLAYLYLIKRSSKSISSYLFARILRLWKYRTFHVRCQAIAIRIFTLISAEYILFLAHSPKGAQKN